MVRWLHQLDGYEFVQALGVGDRQGSMVCCTAWGGKELDTTELPNWTENAGYPVPFTEDSKISVVDLEFEVSFR